MRTISKTHAITASAPDGEHQETVKMSRGKKVLRAPSQSLASVSSSANSSDAEAPASPRQGTIRQPDQPRHAVVIDHQGSGKVVHKPDGTVVWEPATEGADGSTPRRHGPRAPLSSVGEFLGMAGFAFAHWSIGIGAVTALFQTMQAASGPSPRCLTTRTLTRMVGNTVTGFVAGTASGMVVGPLLAARAVVGVAARPVLVGLLLHQGVTRLAGWRAGVVGLLRKLQSADPARVLEALRAIIATAARNNPRFAREFNRLKGMEVLLQKLAAALPDCPMLHLIAQALAELCKDQECRDSLVAAGGVPRLVALLQHPNPVVSGHGLAALACLTDHAVAVEAIRDAGGLSRLVELASAAVAVQPPAPAAAPAAVALGLAVSGASAGTASVDRRAALLPSVKLLQALSLDPAGKAGIGAAGGVQVLLDVVARAPPRSAVQSEAVAALHNCLRGCPDNQRTLAALPAASEVLRGALAGLGPCWHPCKGDLHAMLNVLARLQGVQEAGGFVVIQSQVAAAAAREAATPATTATGSAAGAAAGGPSSRA